MQDIKKIFYNEKKINIVNILLISFLPLALITRSAVINIFTVLIAATFLITLINEKKKKFLNDKIFYLLCFFWSSLIINLFFSTNLESSFFRAIGFGKFILLVFSIKYYLLYKNSKYEKFIYQTWFFIFAAVSLDLLFEFIFGFNSLGYVSPMPGRLSGFLNQELKIGHYYCAFFLISLSHIYCNYKNYFFIYFFSFLFIFISFTIGERSNFIKAFLMFLLFYFIYERKFIFKKTFLLLAFSTLLIFIGLQNDGIKLRLWNQFLKPISHNTKIFDYIKKSKYGAHYDTAIKIFYNYPVFGTGLKNYRNESSKDIYKSSDSRIDPRRWATHPHQIHFEFLSETGIFGYLSFTLFFLLSVGWSIKSYLNRKNIYQLSSILFVIASFLPILPSGSFFTTYGATIFWINFSIMISYNNKKI
jgi:O-antigen ligase